MIPNGYLDPASINVVIGYQVLQFPDLVSTVDLPHPSVQGRPTTLLHISHAPGVRRRVFFVAGVHAREMMNPDMMLSLCYRICDAYRSGSGVTLGGQSFRMEDIRAIVQKLDILLIPLVNPDGRQMVIDSDPSWRKNLRDNGPGQQRGVDLNRNQAFLWGEDSVLGSSDNPHSEIYRGPFVSSEPEGANVIWVLDNYPQIGCFVDVHSYRGLILYPWGDAGNQAIDPSKNYSNPIYDGKRGNTRTYGEYIDPEDWQWHINTANALQLAIANAHGNQYMVKQGYSLYPTTGTFKDAAYAKPYGIRSFTLETGKDTGFIPPWPIAMVTIEETMAGLIQLCLECLPDFEGAWAGTGTITNGAPATAPFRIEFVPQVGGAFMVSEYHNWQGPNLPETPTASGIFTPLNYILLMITSEAAAPGWTAENRWRIELDRIEERISFNVATSLVPPVGSGEPTINYTAAGVLLRAL